MKQYFKEQQALRIASNLEVERVSHQCVLSQDTLDRLRSPTVEAGQRASALRFGDPRVMGLLQAIAGFTHLPIEAGLPDLFGTGMSS